MYGETHVDPAPLFDPRTGQPPADALDVYFHPPLSLSLVADMLARHGAAAELDQLRQVYADVTQQAVVDLQRKAGYVAGGYHGRAVPARLEVTAIVEDTVPGEPTTRLHSHVYVGRTAAALDTGERHPLADDRFPRGVDDTWSAFLTRIIDQTTEALGLVWMATPGGPSGDQEVIDPPPDQWDGHELVVCPGPYGQREQILADADWRADIVEKWRLMTAARERRRTG